MFSLTVMPRFGDIDGLGHMNNTVPSVWFEMARTPILKIFDPELSLDKAKFPLIAAHLDFDFIDQIYLRSEVTVKTWISKIGNKSFTVHHEGWQEGRLCVKGNAIIAYYDFIEEKSKPIPDDMRKLLEEHFIAEESD